MRAEGDARGRDRRIAWSHTVPRDAGGASAHMIATGLDITDRRAMEGALLEISEREQRRIGQDLHDGLGQHLTGMAFMSKVLAAVAGGTAPEAEPDAARIVRLVNAGDRQDAAAGARSPAGT